MWRLLFVVLLFPVVLPGQTLVPLETLHVTSRIVYVDVVVRDGRGQVVRGLTQNDFRVTEDGAQQRIDLFRAYTSNETARTVGPPADAAAAKLEFSNASAGKVSGTVNMILFDLLDTSQANQTYARRQMLKFLTELPPGHRIALFILSDRLHMIQSFTGDSDLLARAAAALLPKASFLFHSASAQARDADVLGMLPASMKSGGDSSFAMDLADELAREDFEHAQERNSVTNAAFRDLAQATSAFPGRKNLIWLSESFPLEAVATLQMFHSPLGSSFFMADLSGSTSKTISDSRIAVYPISVAGLETEGVNATLNGTTAAGGSGAALGGGQAIGNGINTVDPESQGGQAAAQPGGQTGGARLPDTLGQQANSRFALRDQLDEIAEQTGGEAFVGTNDLAGALRKSLEEGENYNSLAYSPSNQKWNGRFRKIRVELPKGYSLSYRRGYYAVEEPAPVELSSTQELDVALGPVSPELDLIPIRSKVYLPNETRTSLQVDALLGAKAVGFVVGADGSRTAQLRVEMIAIPQASPKGEPMGQTAEDLSFHLSEAQYQVATNNGLPVRLQLALKPGRYRIRLGVSDRSNHRIGTVDMPVEIPPA
jgi:VWFA-related protein